MVTGTVTREADTLTHDTQVVRSIGGGGAGEHFARVEPSQVVGKGRGEVHVLGFLLRRTVHDPQEGRVQYCNTHHLLVLYP